jgi:hypothetical protein
MSAVRSSPDTVAPMTRMQPALTRRAKSDVQSFRETPLGRLFHRTFRAAASLQLAISLLSLFTLCLITATLLESAYNARVAQDLIYHTWWFTLLLFFLAVNILCAALKKYPWKRHQAGFLITHLGLIVLVFGGLLTTLGGVEGQMMVLDTAQEDIQQSFRMANRSDTVQLVNQNQIEIYRVPKDKGQATKNDIKAVFDTGMEMPDSLAKMLEGHSWNYSLSPGSFAWRNDAHLQSDLPFLVNALATLARPFPGFSRSLDEYTRFTIENYYPTTERWDFAAAETEDESKTFPAMQIRLTTPMTPAPLKRWVTSLPNFAADPTPISFEMYRLYDPALLPEFLQPPPASALGKTGQLVVAIGPERSLLRVSLDEVKDGETIDLKQAGLKFTVKKRGHLLELQERGENTPIDPSLPLYPAVLFELASEKETGTYIACARMPNLRAFVKGSDVAPVSAWYHFPDFRWGQSYKMGAIQFLKGPDGKVYYRAYGKDGLKGPGKELDVSDPSAVHELPFKPMEMKFEVLTWLPEAVQRDTILPRNVRPGADPAERLEPALRCTLESNGKKTPFWVRLSRAAVSVKAGDEEFFVRFRNDTKRLDFNLTLKRARQVSDPGTNRPASFESEVVLGHEKDGKKITRDYTISMNNTLDHGGFKVYQTNYRPMTHPRTGDLLVDDEGHLVSMSGFTIADDPGLFCKYLGSCLLVLGIATMFWMRAYFFKSRRTVPSAA